MLICEKYGIMLVLRQGTKESLLKEKETVMKLGVLTNLFANMSLEEAIEAVLPHLGCAMVVKMGSKGSLLVRKDGSRNMLPSFLNRNVVDAIGAGDSFNSGFVSAFVKGLPLEKCQEIGNMTGALNPTAAGGTGAFTSPEEIDQRAIKLFGRTLGL